MSVFEVTLLTLRVAVLAVLIDLVPGVLLGRLLARREFPGKGLLTTIVLLPMVLPPVAVGLVLLRLLARDAPLGAALSAWLGHPVLLSWEAAVLAAAVMAFPLVVLGARAGFAAVPRRLEQVAESLGASRARVFFAVALPVAARPILHGLCFAFARALGEFGATTLVAGHVPGRTETLALAIYDRVQRFDDPAALELAAVSCLLALAVTLPAERLLRSRR